MYPVIERRFLTLSYGETAYVSSSRSLARHLLFNHLKSLDTPLHTFLSLSDPKWMAYQRLKKVRDYLRDYRYFS